MQSISNDHQYASPSLITKAAPVPASCSSPVRHASCHYVHVYSRMAPEPQKMGAPRYNVFLSA
ncbi:hypothetical protein JAAARDRAFT_58357 [Jaapia argillacea MUCL 33604]|uniref:Uncharacterized protein n=1 Tax=Jaapia argillacea MUCL 33604 TaxID=933084 RepID=A0A067PSH7_9AGAM|nr:hypothetical protein JAAARDRAFT_58357 [Jaapia argillacea MUCL 33604]